MIAKFQQAALSAALLASVTLLPSIAYADASLFKEHCAKCHARASSLASGLKGQTADEKASQLEAFLTSHHVDDAAARAHLVTYLVGLAK